MRQIVQCDHFELEINLKWQLSNIITDILHL